MIILFLEIVNPVNFDNNQSIEDITLKVKSINGKNDN